MPQARSPRNLTVLVATPRAMDTTSRGKWNPLAKTHSSRENSRRPVFLQGEGQFNRHDDGHGLAILHSGLNLRCLEAAMAAYSLEAVSTAEARAPKGDLVC